MKIMQTNKKILFYIGSLARGGAERVVVNLAEYMEKMGYQVAIVTKEQTENEYPVAKAIGRIHADIYDDEISGSRIVNFYRRVRKLRKIWKEEKPDIIVSFIKKNNLMAILSSRGLQVPVLVAIRSAAFREYPGIFRMAAKVLFPMADGVIVQTKEQAEYFGKKVFQKTKMLPNAVRDDFMGSVYQGPRDNRIVTVGRIDDNKNQIMLIKAFSRIADKFPHMKVVIYGNGEAEKRIKQAIEEQGLSGRVILAGHVSDIKTAIERARIFVLTSRVEGMPNALIEAMALGLVPISTDFGGGGVRQLIRDGENGFIIPIDDVSALSEKMELILGNGELEMKLRNHAVEIQKQFAPELVNQQWKQYFEKFMG